MVDFEDWVTETSPLDPCFVPVEELSEDRVSCDGCKTVIPSEACPDSRYGILCAKCMAEGIEVKRAEARAIAEECAITRRPLPPYDPSLEYRCTPEDYKNGYREAYTPNSYLRHCRHNLTNYDELIVGLDKLPCPAAREGRRAFQPSEVRRLKENALNSPHLIDSWKKDMRASGQRVFLAFAELSRCRLIASNEARIVAVDAIKDTDKKGWESVDSMMREHATELTRFRLAQANDVRAVLRIIQSTGADLQDLILQESILSAFQKGVADLAGN